jgi:hypothetical protein
MHLLTPPNWLKPSSVIARSCSIASLFFLKTSLFPGKKQGWRNSWTAVSAILAEALAFELFGDHLGEAGERSRRCQLAIAVSKLSRSSEFRLGEGSGAWRTPFTALKI